MVTHYITPYSTEGNIGQAYNGACSAVDDPDTWIIIRDGDTMFMTPEWGTLIHRTLERHGKDFQLFGAMTNRVRDYHHKVPGMFDELNMREHYKKAKELQDTEETNVFQTVFDVAGFFMCFQKKTWEDVGGFEEGTPIFDRLFSRTLRKKGGKIAIMKGLYVLHSYRIWSDDPLGETGHLD